MMRPPISKTDNTLDVMINPNDVQP